MQLTGFASLIISSWQKRREREREDAFDTEDRSRFSRLVSHGFINRTPYPFEKKREGGERKEFSCVARIITRRSHAYAICRLSSGMREYMSISCTFATNNACRHLARRYGYRGVKDAHVKRTTYIYTRLLASVYTLRMYISAINTPNRFVNLGRWKVGIEGKKKVRGSLFKSPRTCSYRRMALIGIRLGSLSCSPLFRPVRACSCVGLRYITGHFAFP